jgi:putative two-component system response regulator
MLRLVERSLGERYRCEFATTAQLAREKFAVGTFDLALCDLEMLGESGLDWAEEITEDHPDTAVILISGEDDPEVARKAFAFGGRGVHGYLVKPFWP